jgi:hypothetical protein
VDRASDGRHELMATDRKAHFGVVAVPPGGAIGYEFVEKIREQLVQDLSAAGKQSVYQPALRHSAPGPGFNWQDVAFHDRNGPVAFCEDPGGQQSAHARAENYCSLT